MAGSAAITLYIGLRGGTSPKAMLLFGTALMAGTGAGFAAVTGFWPLLLIGFIGTMNPSAGDVSLFLPLEQSLLSERVSASQRTALFARYSLGGNFAGALGALAAALPGPIARATDTDLTDIQRGVFLVYGATAVAVLWLYLPRPNPPPRLPPPLLSPPPPPLLSLRG